MKDHGSPMVTISQEHFEQLQECKKIVEAFWRKFGPHSWPREFHLPAGTTFYDIQHDPEEMYFYQLRTRFDRLFDYDDSE